MGIISLISGALKLFGFVFEIFSERQKLMNTPEMKANAQKLDEQKIIDEARRAIEKQDLEDIRKMLSI